MRRALCLAALACASPSFAQEDGTRRSFDVFGEDDEPEPEAVEPRSPEAVEPRSPEAPPTAERRPAVLALVLGTGKDAGARASRLGEVLTQRLARARGLAPLDLEQAVAPGARAQREQEVKAGLAAITRGLASFDDLDLEVAGGALEEGINALLSHLEDLDAPERERLEGAMFTFAATTLFEGQTALAESIFIALLLLNPAFEPDRDRYPSSVVNRFVELKGGVDARPTGGLMIHSVPPGADIYVDGVHRGTSPVEVQGLLDGQHVVVAKKLGHRPFGTLAPVTADRSANLDVDLPAMEGAVPLELEPYLANDLEQALVLGKRLGVSLLLVLRLDVPISGPRVEGQLLAVEEGRPVARLSSLRVADDVEAAATSVEEALREAEAARLVRAQPPPIDSGPSGGKDWWVWALVGGVAVAGAALAVAAAVDGGGPDRPPPNGLVLGF